MPRQNDKDNGRKRGPARPRPRGEGFDAGKRRPSHGSGKQAGRGQRSRSHEGDEERRNFAPAGGKRKPGYKAGQATRPPREQGTFRRDDERRGERPPRKTFGEGSRPRRDSDEARPFRARRPFREDRDRDADRAPRKTFGDRDRRRDDAGGVKPYRKDGPPRRFERPRAGVEEASRKTFGDRRRDDAGGAKPYRKDGPPRRFERPRAGVEEASRKTFGEGSRPRRDSEEARPFHARRPFREDRDRDADRAPRKTFGDRDRRRDDAGGAKPYRKDGPPRRFERPRTGVDEAPRKHFARPRHERDDRDAERAPRRFGRPPEDRAFHAHRPERGGWQEHPRSEGRDAARPRRSAAVDDRAFRKRPAFGDAVRAARKPRGEAPPPPRADKTGERIAKLVARAGLASRREAEAWVTQGRVAVNGRVITSPALDVTPRDVVTVDGAALPERERTRLFLYHKPRGLMTTHADPEGRPTVFDNLPAGLPRLISVGRLDFSTEGLLLLTNDGGLARELELPQTGWLRRYRVRAHGEVTQPQLDGLRDGITIDGVRYGAIEARLEREQGSNSWLTFAIREGKNREVRNVLAHLGLEVNRLIRVSYGPFQLGELGEGEAEEVKARVLREQIGETLLRRAGADVGAAATAPVAPASAGRDGKPAAKPRPKKSVVADRKGRKVVVERAGGGDGEPRGPAPYRRPQRRYHGKRDLAPRD